MTKAQQLHLATLAPYLPFSVEVAHAAHGRGTLVGLPACHINDHGPLASVRFDGLPSFPDYYELGSVKPVLYDFNDAYEVLKGKCLDSPSEESTKWGVLWSNSDSLEFYAQLVDDARALGIALNLPAGSYIRKEVARG